MKKHFFKLRFLPLLILFLVFTNCQDDPYENTPALPQAKDGKFNIITGQKAAEIKNRLITRLKKGNGEAMQKLSSTIINDPSFRGYVDIEPYIDRNIIIGVENTNGIINYTLGVNMPDSSPEKFYNVVFSTYNNSGKVMLLTYNLEKQFAEEYAGISGDMGNFTGTIDFEPISLDDNFPCDNMPSIPIPVSGGIATGGGYGGGSGGGSGGGTGTGGSPSSGNPYSQALIDAQFLQSTIVKPKVQVSTITTGPIEPTEGGNEPPTGGTDFPFINFPIMALSVPGFTSSDDPCDPGQQIGILEPDNPQKAFEKNCDELQKFSANAKNLVALKDVQNTAFDDDEDGYSYSDDKDPQTLEHEPPPASILVKVPSGGLIYGASHDHPDPATTPYIPMFSISDIASLGRIAAQYKGVPKNYNKFIFTLSIAYGGGKQTYAIKIDNYLQFLNFVNSYYASEDIQNKHRFDLNRLYSKVPPMNGPSGYLNTLFKYMNKENIKGISIYKANDNQFGSWSRLAYDPQSNGYDEIPCK